MHWTVAQWSLYRRLTIWEDRPHHEALSIVESAGRKWA